MDINEIAQAHLKEMAESGKIADMVKSNVEEAVKKAISSAFSGYSDFTKSIEKAIEDTVKVDIEDLGLAGYNQVVAQVVRQQLDGFFYQQAAEEVKKNMEGLLRDFPQEIKVSEIAEMFAEKMRNSYHCSCDTPRFTFLVEPSERTDGYFDLYIDEDAGKDKFECSYRLRCREDGVWSARIEGTDLKKNLFMGALFDFERFIFHAYTNKVKVILDTEEPSNWYGEGEDYGY